MPTPYRLLTAAHISLWDVLANCERKCSLDSHIRNEKANDFAAFFAQHPHITRVYFNGAKAEQSFKKFVLGKQKLSLLEFVRLPSTSPAHAGMRYEEKLKLWSKLLAQAVDACEISIVMLNIDSMASNHLSSALAIPVAQSANLYYPLCGLVVLRVF